MRTRFPSVFVGLMLLPELEKQQKLKQSDQSRMLRPGPAGGATAPFLRPQQRALDGWMGGSIHPSTPDSSILNWEKCVFFISTGQTDSDRLHSEKNATFYSFFLFSFL